MNTPPLLQTPPSGASTAPYQQRTDQEQHRIVNQGIAVQSNVSTICAIEYLKSYNVDPEVIERVLLHPDRRRSTEH